MIQTSISLDSTVQYTVGEMDIFNSYFSGHQKYKT
jgi:hypothetical protein